MVVLSFFADKQADEVGAELSISGGNVRVIRHRALARLRECMGAGERRTMTCENPIGFETLVAYWLGEVPEARKRRSRSTSSAARIAPSGSKASPRSPRACARR